MKVEGGVECLWSDLSEHPQCPHGPTLLFARSGDGNLEKFYACSACRNRKQCNFYMQHGQKQKDTQKKFWAQEKKKVMPNCNHRLLYIRFNEALTKSSIDRNYCNNCGKLVFTHEIDKHKDHDIIKNLSDYQMYHPTELLKPLTNPQKEAQYLFSKKSTKDIVDILLNVGAKQVLCIGTPRVHEYIIENYEFKMSTLLLDFDRRYHNFFGPLSFCWYNLFNHHFFSEEAQSVFKDFMTQNAGKHTYLLCDPPFGGRTEAISQTVKTISDLHKKWNKIENDEDCLHIVFIFPYFMEGIIQKRSTPPSIIGGLKDLKMADYKVDYDNHDLFVSTNERKVGSPIRIFTNVPLNLLQLPEEDGYKYCKRCQKWVSKENKHCKICKQCTSKDGKRYKHCTLCNRCVKPTWKHCDVCQKCAIGTHICGQKPKIIGCCLKCNEHGHTEQDCKTEATNENIKIKKSKKRKANGEYANSTMKNETFPKEKINTKNSETKSKGIKKPKLGKLENSEDCTTSKKSDKLKSTNGKKSVIKHQVSPTKSKVNKLIKKKKKNEKQIL